MANKNLTNAKRAKNDEFYTQYSDIQKEINAYLEYNQFGRNGRRPCGGVEQGRCYYYKKLSDVVQNSQSGKRESVGEKIIGVSR